MGRLDQVRLPARCGRRRHRGLRQHAPRHAGGDDGRRREAAGRGRGECRRRDRRRSQPRGRGQCLRPRLHLRGTPALQAQAGLGARIFRRRQRDRQPPGRGTGRGGRREAPLGQRGGADSPLARAQRRNRRRGGAQLRLLADRPGRPHRHRADGRKSRRAAGCGRSGARAPYRLPGRLRHHRHLPRRQAGARARDPAGGRGARALGPGSRPAGAAGLLRRRGAAHPARTGRRKGHAPLPARGAQLAGGSREHAHPHPRWLAGPLLERGPGQAERRLLDHPKTGPAPRGQGEGGGGQQHRQPE